jgi:PAS domain S-box-containing protein
MAGHAEEVPMAKRPTYEELEQRIRDLEEEAVKRKRAGEALLESEIHYKTAFEHSNDGIAMVRGDNYIYANKKFVEIFGYDELKEIVGRPITMTIHPEDREQVTEFNRLRQQGKPVPSSYECKGIRKDGEAIFLEVSATKSIYRGEPISLVYFRDTTQRKEREKALKEHEEQYRNLFENAPLGLGLGDENGNIIDFNDAMLRPGGYNREDISEIGNMARIFYSPDERNRIFAIARRQGFIDQAQVRLKRKDGTPYDALLSLRLILIKGKHCWQAMIQDITERKRAEDALRASEAQKSAILDASIDRIRYVDKDMKIIWGNKTTALVHDMSPEDLVGMTCYEAFLGRDTPCKGCPTVKALETGRVESAEIYQPQVKGIKGGTYWNAYCVPLRDKDGDIEGFIQIGRDITARKLAEERIHILSQQLLKAQENERQRISRYLHDYVAQDLSSLKIGCETLFDDYADAPLEKKIRVSELSEIIQGTITAVRRLAYDLRPPGLDQFGLIQSVFQYCEDFSDNTGLSVDFKAAGMDDLRVDPEIEINLYRLVQEGLNNIKKHAEADHVIIRLVASFPNIILRIEDDGKGFDVEGRLLRASKEKRMGLGSMEERVKLLNGGLRIQSRLMEGTKIVIEIPFKEKKSEQEEIHLDH